MTTLNTQELVKLSYRMDDRIGVLTLNNPPVNALSAQLRTEFLSGVKKLLSKKNVKMLVITGEGRGFSAGADLLEVAEVLETLKHGEDEMRNWLLEGHKFVNAVASIPLMKVALIHGFAMGGGLELALSCDILVTVGKVKIALLEANLGILPGWGGTIRTEKIMGKETAEEFYGSGRTIDAAEAHNLGLVFHAHEDMDQAWVKLELLTSEFASSLDDSESAREIEAFLDKVRPGNPGEDSPALEKVRAFINRSK